MSSGKRIVTVAAADPRSVELFLVQRLGVTSELARQLIDSGGVSVSGRRAPATQLLVPGDRVQVATPRPVVEEEPRIVYADRWMLAVDKPAGWLSQPSPGDSRSLESWLAPRHPDARLLHRIDRETSGLVLFSLSTDAHGPLQRLLAAGQLARRYVAIVAGRLEGDGLIDLKIARHPHDATLRQALPTSAPAGQPARTRFSARPIDGNRSWVELTLDTGRTHQARLHLAGVGHPVVGDTAYGGPAGTRLFLHATRLELGHPSDGRAVVIDSSIPATFAPAPVDTTASTES